MINVILFSAVAFIYLFSSLLYFCCLFFKKEKIGKAATSVAAVGLFVQSSAYGVRWMESYQSGVAHTPFSFFTLYETLIFTCWSMAIAYLVVEYKYQMRALGAIVLPLISLGMLYASLSPNVAGEIEALPSVLKGNVFIYHVVSCFFGIAAFGISCLVSVFTLIMGNPGRAIPLLKKFLDRLPPSEILEDLSYKTLAVGFVLFSIGMATGVYQAKMVWHIYWNWDPAQTCTLITWFLYALILHGRYQRWWGIKVSSLLSLTAFITLVISALIAANYIMESGHYPVV